MPSNREFLGVLNRLLSDCKDSREKEEMIFLRLRDVKNIDERISKFAAVIRSDLFSKKDEDLLRGLKEINLQDSHFHFLASEVLNPQGVLTRPPERGGKGGVVNNPSNVVTKIKEAGWEWPPKGHKR